MSCMILISGADMSLSDMFMILHCKVTVIVLLIALKNNIIIHQEVVVFLSDNHSFLEKTWALYFSLNTAALLRDSKHCFE